MASGAAAEVRVRDSIKPAGFESAFTRISTSVPGFCPSKSSIVFSRRIEAFDLVEGSYLAGTHIASFVVCSEAIASVGVGLIGLGSGVAVPWKDGVAVGIGLILHPTSAKQTRIIGMLRIRDQSVS